MIIRPAAILFACFIAVACQETGQNKDKTQASDVKLESTMIAEFMTAVCTTTQACNWGEVCMDSHCVVPENVSLGKLAYDFTAQDQCPGSETYKQDVALSDYHGSVILLYFATTGCDACKADVQVYEAIIQQMKYKGFIGISMITVILPYSAQQITEFTAPLHSPVVVDNPDIAIADHYGATKDYVFLIDRAGYVRKTYPSLEVRPGMTSDRKKLSQEIIELLSE